MVMQKRFGRLFAQRYVQLYLCGKMKTSLCKGCHRLKTECRCKQIHTQAEAVLPQRESAAKRGYDSKWRAFRKRLWQSIIRSGSMPCCSSCGFPFGGETPHFDHIEPVQSDDDPRFYDRTNIQFLHRACHSAKTVQDMKNGKTRTAFKIDRS